MPKTPSIKEELLAAADEHGWRFVDLYVDPPLKATVWVLAHPSDWWKVRLEFSGRGNVTRAWLETLDGPMAYIPYAGHGPDERNETALEWLRMRSREAWREGLCRAARGVLDTLAVTAPSRESAADMLRDVEAICAQLIAGVRRVADGEGFRTAEGYQWDPSGEDGRRILDEADLPRMAAEAERASRAPGADPCDLGPALGQRLAEEAQEELRVLQAHPEWR